MHRVAVRMAERHGDLQHHRLDFFDRERLSRGLPQPDDLPKRQPLEELHGVERVIPVQVAVVKPNDVLLRQLADLANRLAEGLASLRGRVQPVVQHLQRDIDLNLLIVRAIHDAKRSQTDQMTDLVTRLDDIAQLERQLFGRLLRSGLALLDGAQGGGGRREGLAGPRKTLATIRTLGSAFGDLTTTTKTDHVCAPRTFGGSEWRALYQREVAPSSARVAEASGASRGVV